MGSNMVDVKLEGRIKRLVNGEPHQMLDGRTLLFNDQGQIVQLGLYCYLS